MKKVFVCGCVALVIVCFALAQPSGTAQRTEVPAQKDREVTGKTKPSKDRYSKFGPNRNAVVRKVCVAVGDHVKKGDLLVLMAEEKGELDAATAALESAKLQLQSATIVLKLAEHELHATERLEKNKIVSKVEKEADTLKRDNARTKMLLAQSQVAEKRGELEKAKANFEYFHVKAETDGTVISLNVAPGQIGRTVPDINWGEILDTTEMDVECAVSQKVCSAVTVKQKVTVRCEQETFEAVVTFVGVTVDEKGCTPVIVHVCNPNRKLRCNQAVTISLEG